MARKIVLTLFFTCACVASILRGGTIVSAQEQQEYPKAVRAGVALLKAVCRGDVKGARTALSQGADPDFCAFSKLSPALYKQFDREISKESTWIENQSVAEVVFGETKNLAAIASLLMAKGLSDNEGDSTGYSSFMIMACSNGWTNIVEQFIQRGANVNQVSESGETPLGEAVVGGYTDMVKLLVQCSATINQPYVSEYVSKFIAVPLIHAADQGYLDIVSYLVKKGAQLEETIYPGAIADNSGYTALLAAARKKHWGVVKALYNRGANLNASADGGGTTAMIYALAHCDLTPVKDLARDGARIPSEQELKACKLYKNANSSDQYQMIHSRRTAAAWAERRQNEVAKLFGKVGKLPRDVTHYMLQNFEQGVH